MTFDANFLWGMGALLFGAAILFGGVVPAVRTQRAKATIDLQDAELNTFRQALVDMEDRCKAREQEQERRHVREMGELRGRVDAMTPEFAANLAAMVAVALKEEGIHG